MAPHSSTLAWKIPWTEEPGGLQSMGLQRVRHDWAPSLSLFTFLHWSRKWQPTPVFLPRESQGRGSLVGCCLWGCTVGHDWSDLAEFPCLSHFQEHRLTARVCWCINGWTAQNSYTVHEMTSQKLSLKLKARQWEKKIVGAWCCLSLPSRVILKQLSLDFKVIFEGVIAFSQGWGNLRTH